MGFREVGGLALLEHILTAAFGGPLSASTSAGVLLLVWCDTLV